MWWKGHLNDLIEEKDVISIQFAKRSKTLTPILYWTQSLCDGKTTSMIWSKKCMWLRIQFAKKSKDTNPKFMFYN